MRKTIELENKKITTLDCFLYYGFSLNVKTKAIEIGKI